MIKNTIDSDNGADGIVFNPKIIAGLNIVDPDTVKADSSTIIGSGGKPPVKITINPITENPSTESIFNIKPDSSIVLPDSTVPIKIPAITSSSAIQSGKINQKVGTSASFLGGSTVTLFVILVIIGAIIYFKTK